MRCSLEIDESFKRACNPINIEHQSAMAGAFFMLGEIRAIYTLNLKGG
jgi:hypothetical protein